MNQIEVDDDIYQLLRDHAEPFVDTPNTVLRRLLAVDGTHPPTEPPSANRTPVHKAARPMPKKSNRATKRTRAAAGTLLPEKEYEVPVLAALDENGGSAPSRVVVDRVGELVGDRLTDFDHESLASGGLRWQSRIQFVRLRLIERELMEKNTPRGIWAITERGREYLAQARNGGN